MKLGIRWGLKTRCIEAAEAIGVTIFFDVLILRIGKAFVRGEAGKCSQNLKNAIQAII